MNQDPLDTLGENPRESAIWLIGQLLLLTQATEDQFSHVLRVVFKDGVLTAQDFIRSDKKTLGQLFKDLEKQLEISEDFKTLLALFIDQRNLFVHNLRYQPWFDLSTEEGINTLWQFLDAYQNNLEQVLNTFVAYGLKMADDIGVPREEEYKLMTESGYLPYIQDKYYPELGRVLKRKKP